MDYLSFFTISSGGSVIIGLTGLFLVIRIWIKWQSIDLDVIKARVFLNNSFLTRNWIYTFLSGASQAAHQFLDFMISLNNISRNGFSNNLSDFLGIMVLIFLVILAYEWYIMIYPKKCA